MEDISGKIIDYENGDMDIDDIINLFAELVGTGYAWKLQGHYGRTANTLIENGYISDNGEILKLS